MKKGIFILFVCYCAAVVLSCSKDNGSPEPETPSVTTLSIVDKSATAETKALYANLWQIGKIAPMFGHHDYPAYGVGWRDTDGGSDVKYVCGDYPALYSADLGGIDRGESENINSVPVERFRTLIKQVYSRGGVIMFCWHQDNPLTGGNAWDNTKVVDKILTEGSEMNIKYKGWLDNLAAFFGSLRDNSGNLIPVLFRPLHEHTQSWSWWGSSATTDTEFVNFWKFIVNYLRDVKGVHNVLYVISPQMDADYGSATTDRLKFRWPGDEYVDIIGMDCYHGTNTSAFKSNLSYLSSLSVRLKKPVGVTETGIASGRSGDYWTKQIGDPVKGVYCSMVVMWRNESVSHAFGPYPGDVSANDFVKMFESKSLKFEKDLPAMYSMPENIEVK
jgi:mannan endo-1,4-beta-mannosidase